MHSSSADSSRKSAGQGGSLQAEMASTMSDPFFHMFLLDNMDTDSLPAPTMDMKISSRMPFDLLKVLLRVPLDLASQAKFRAVSKPVRSFLSSKGFQLEAAKISLSCGRLPICALVCSHVLSKEGGGVVPELQAPYEVHKLNLSFLPAEFRMLDTLTPDQNRNLHIGKGVVFLAKKLLKNERHVGEKICMVNPINQTWSSCRIWC